MRARFRPESDTQGYDSSPMVLIYRCGDTSQYSGKYDLFDAFFVCRHVREVVYVLNRWIFRRHRVLSRLALARYRGQGKASIHLGHWAGNHRPWSVWCLSMPWNCADVVSKYGD